MDRSYGLNEELITNLRFYQISRPKGRISLIHHHGSLTVDGCRKFPDGESSSRESQSHGMQ